MDWIPLLTVSAAWLTIGGGVYLFLHRQRHIARDEFEKRILSNVESTIKEVQTDLTALQVKTNTDHKFITDNLNRYIESTDKIVESFQKNFELHHTNITNNNANMYEERDKLREQVIELSTKATQLEAEFKSFVMIREVIPEILSDLKLIKHELKID